MSSVFTEFVNREELRQNELSSWKLWEINAEHVHTSVIRELNAEVQSSRRSQIFLSGYLRLLSGVDNDNILVQVKDICQLYFLFCCFSLFGLCILLLVEPFQLPFL